MRNYKKRTLDTGSSRISDQESTLRSKDCVPFWTESTKEWSKRLWSCMEIGLQDLDTTYWNTSSKKKDTGSWFTVKAKVPNQPSNLPNTLWQSPLSLSHLIMENEQRKTEENVNKEEAKKRRKIAWSKAEKVYHLPRARKIRIYPPKKERDTLVQWFGATRRAYNIAVEVDMKLKQGDEEISRRFNEMANEVKRDKLGQPIIKERQGKKYPLTRGSEDAKKMLARHMEKEDKLEWVMGVPQAVRDSGIRDYFKARRSGDAKNEEKKHQGELKVREVFKFRSKKDTSQTFEINARDFNRKGGKIKKLLQKCRTKKKECLPDNAECAIRVHMDKLGKISLCFVREVKSISESKAPGADGSFHSTCALDPGVRTFQAIYDADGQGIEWGKGDMNKIFRLCRHADQIQQKIKKKRATYSLRRAYYRKLKKVKDTIKDCHRKLALFLCENFKTILIPEFQVSRMIKKRNRKLNSKTVRMMCSWSHYSFRQALLSKAELYPWVNVVVVDESYTSKTCEECGCLKDNLGGSKVFKCDNCGFIADRDLHAARNILLRYLTREGIDVPVPERVAGQRGQALRVL